MRTHEEFCAEILLRKNNIIRKRKERRRVVLACVPFVLCATIFAGVGMSGNIVFPQTPDVNETGGVGSHLTGQIEETYEREELTDQVVELLPPDGDKHPSHIEGVGSDDEILDGEHIEGIPETGFVDEGTEAEIPEWENESDAVEWDTFAEFESEANPLESDSDNAETEPRPFETGIA